MAALRVMVVAEGPSELGDLDQLAGYVRSSGRREGYIPAMLRKLFGVKLDIQAQRVTRLGRFERSRRLAGEGDRAAGAVAVAEAKDCALLVFVRDVDREHGSKRSAVERRRKLRHMHEQIDAGFAAARSERVTAVKATPCRMLEAWALGDARALEQLGADSKRLREVPHHPEEAWGSEKDPASRHPKCILRRVLGREASASIFEEIARTSRPDHLAKTCPDSFGTFLEEIARARDALATSATSGGRKRS